MTLCKHQKPMDPSGLSVMGSTRVSSLCNHSQQVEVGGLSEGLAPCRAWIQMLVSGTTEVSHIHPALFLHRGPSTKTSWPGSAMRTS